jgi:hypothetical protein
MPVRVFAAVSLTAMTVLSGRVASAQPPPGPDPSGPARVLTQRPYRGVFAGGTGQTAQLLTLNLNMGGGFDSSVFVDNRTDPNAFEPITRKRTGFLNGSADLNYALNLDKVTFTAAGGAAVSHYPDLRPSTAERYFANASGGWQMSTRTNLSGQYWMTFLPVTHLIALPLGNNPSYGPGNPFDNTTGAQAESYRTATATVDFSHQISRRVSTSLRYSNWRVSSPDSDHDVSTHGGSARLSYSLTRTMAVYGGYRVDTGLYNDDARVVASPRYYTQGADFGLDFAKALSISRKTTATFSVGMTGVSDGNRTQYAATGQATVTRDIGRSWVAWVSYYRNVSFAQAFTEPIFADSLTAQLSGLFTRRLRFDADMGIAFGRVGLAYTRTADDDYRAIYASTSIGYAISRHFDAGARYWYTRHQFDRGLSLPSDLLFHTGRHGLNGYLTTWIPIFKRTRRP